MVPCTSASTSHFVLTFLVRYLYTFILRNISRLLIDPHTLNQHHPPLSPFPFPLPIPHPPHNPRLAVTIHIQPIPLPHPIINKSINSIRFRQFRSLECLSLPVINIISISASPSTSIPINISPFASQLCLPFSRFYI